MKYFLILILFFSCIYKIHAQQASPKYEFRAVWVATVANIDWPSKPGLSADDQKKEIIQILDMHKQLGMNAVILQVRPSADALYESSFEPWSRYLSGIPGIAPTPYYDPLQFWIVECHKRGMELHAWLNPFRVGLKAEEPLAGNHIAFKHPDWILKYGNTLYFDPGIPETRKFVGEVVKDIVSRYDVDAIHFDDYFYPYPLAEEFPDTTSFKLYNRGFTPETKKDWRRDNVNLIIKSLNGTIKNAKPWVKFGISPFGVWRNKADDPTGSDTRAGATNYDHLYADVITWQKEGWIDYLLPQLYWQIGHPLVDFELLANWWKNHHYERAVYVGHGVYKSDPESQTIEWSMPGELPKQIRLLRSIHEIQGSAFYSSKHFKRNLMGFQDQLKQELFRQPAIVPPMNWIDSKPPEPVKAINASGKKVKWEVAASTNEMDKANQFVVYMNELGKDCDTNTGNNILMITTDQTIKLSRINKKKKKYEIRISVLDRLNNESLTSQPVILKL